MSDDDRTKPHEETEVLDELDFTTPRLKGRAEVPFVCDYVRDLNQADQEALATRGRSTPQPTLQTIRARHHAVARCMALGMSCAQVSAVTGYSYQRVISLQDDPLFRQLVADYRADNKTIIADFTERLLTLGLDATAELAQLLDEKPGELSASVLLDIIKTTADRTGHGPGAELTVRSLPETIDRPPRETYEEWKARRTRELALPDPKQVN